MSIVPGQLKRVVDAGFVYFRLDCLVYDRKSCASSLSLELSSYLGCPENATEPPICNVGTECATPNTIGMWRVQNHHEPLLTDALRGCHQITPSLIRINHMRTMHVS